jgi:O-methyltransferase
MGVSRQGVAAAASYDPRDDATSSGKAQPLTRDPHTAAPSSRATGLAREYVELLKASLTGTAHQDVYTARPSYTGPRARVDRRLAELACAALRKRDWEIVRRAPHALVEAGHVRPLSGETMVGRARLDNLQECIEHVVDAGVPGDLIETGVWRGGASIFMRGVLRALEVTDRSVWVADSFRGLPPPSADVPADAGDEHHLVPELAVSVETVRENFRRYGLLDDRVVFLEGWFRDTLPALGAERWAIIRLDGDMYESTMDALESLYPRLSAGGFVIVDDGALPACRAAVDDFRGRNAITEPLQAIDWTGLFWQRSA